MMSGASSAVEAHTGHNIFLKLVHRISTLAGWCSAAMIVAAVTITCQMIFVRFILDESTIWQTEAVIYLVVAATLIGLPYVQQLRGHVNVDLFPLHLSYQKRFYLSLVTSALSIMIIGVILFYGTEYWHETWSRGWKSDTIWAVRLWIPYLAIPIGFGLLLLQLIADLLAVIIGVDKPFSLEDED